MCAAQPTYISALGRKSTHGKSHKRLINKACIEVLESKDAHPREKMKAAGILERMARERDLAARRRKKKSAQISAHVENKADNRLTMILEGASDSTRTSD